MNIPEPETTAAQADESPLARLGWWCVGWIPIFAGLVVCVWPSLGAAWTVALPAGFLACWGGAVILHEMGHLLAARLLRLHPFGVLIGHGPTVWEGSLFGLYWTFDGGRHWTRATGNMPPVRVDRVILNDATNDLIVATHGRGIIVLDDVASLEAGSAPVARGDVKLLPVRSATTAYEWRDLPWAAPNAFVAPNPPLGTYITYSIGEIAGTAPASGTAADASSNGAPTSASSPSIATAEPNAAPDCSCVARSASSGTNPELVS